ncbi:MAG: type II toxin-antitoxin system mRNA interferase toxin, RelE/StbE family [Chloroflexi bacterium]|nr:type II toxin-antitoxin system mRNA interferase toxin, RelE/StbE family [Chloroflexota bacterium]
MRNLVWGSSFKRALKRTLRRHPKWRERIADVLDDLAADAFTPQLETHKLKGELAGLWACTVEYDCRIVFEFVKHLQIGEEEILLIDIGTHDQVY